jgi:hypothetical protein
MPLLPRGDNRQASNHICPPELKFEEMLALAVTLPGSFVALNSAVGGSTLGFDDVARRGWTGCAGNVVGRGGGRDV